MKLPNMTITRRLWFLAGVAVISLLLVGVTAIAVSATLSGRLRQLSDQTVPGVKALMEARNATTSIRALLVMHLAALDDTQRREIEAQLGKLGMELKRQIDTYASLVTDEAEVTLSQTDAQAAGAFGKTFNEVMKNLHDNAKFVARQQIESKAIPEAKLLEASLAKHTEFALQQAEKRRASTDRIIVSGQAISWIVMILGAGVVGALSAMLIRKISGDLGTMRDALMMIERDLDFTRRVDIRAQDELGAATAAVNSLLDKLHANFSCLNDAVSKVALAADSLKQTTQQVAEASVAQSESASSMAASIEQLTVSIHHVGDRANDSDRLSAKSGEVARKGCQVIGQTVQDIGDISDAVSQSSRRIEELEQQSNSIADVIRVIKEVAEQTNMLALNAAIEAARAGEHGRGFAVVADEVRKLAERTTSSAHDISSTIEAMRHSASAAVSSMEMAVSRVVEGVARAQDAQAAVTQIDDSSRSVVIMVSEISTAIREQSQSSILIAQRIEQIAQMTETTSAAAATGAQAADQLNDLAGEMNSIIASYRL